MKSRKMIDAHSAAMQGQKVTLDWMEDPNEKKEEAARLAAEANDPVKKLELQIAELKGLVAAQNQPVPQVVPVFSQQRPNLPTEPDFSKLPDVMADPTGYAKKMQAAMAEAQRNKEILAKFDADQLQAQKNASDKLYADFSKKFPAYAKNRVAVEAFAEAAAMEAKQRQMDVGKYMFATPDVFFKDVVKLMDDSGFKPAGAPQVEEEEEEQNRGFGIPGGGAPSGAGKAVEAEQPRSSMQGLRAWQIKTGFHI